MCICKWYLHFHSGYVAKLWAGSWVFLSQVPPSSSGHWTYEAPSSPPQTESDNNGPLERKRRVLSGRCLAEYQHQLSPSVNIKTTRPWIASAHTVILFETQELVNSFEQRHEKNPVSVSVSTMSADKHRKNQFVKHHAVASFVFLLCVLHVCMRRPLVTNSSIIPSPLYIP